MKAIITSIIYCFLIVTSVLGQPAILKSRVYLKEKQNRPAVGIPSNLLKAYSQGDIKAYYPKALMTPVPYVQFLNHFGMKSRAFKEITNDAPPWFCGKREYVQVDPMVKKCMQYNFEIGEQSVRNNITYQQEIKLVYVKVIYTGECSGNGLEKEGPVFKIGDIKKLKQNEYKIVNPENTAVSYTIADYLALRLFRAEKMRR